MQLVIEIPKEVYENFQNAKCIGESKYKDHLVEIYFGIKKGIVLPKHHGRLGDLDRVKAKVFNASMDERFMPLTCDDVIDIIDYIPTIIEGSDLE